MVISLDEENKNAVLSLRQTEILAKLQPLTSEIDANTDSSYVCFFLRFVYYLTFLRISVPTFHPEYGRYMLESTPGSPYTGSIRDLLSVESNMRYR